MAEQTRAETKLTEVQMLRQKREDVSQYMMTGLQSLLVSSQRAHKLSDLQTRQRASRLSAHALTPAYKFFRRGHALAEAPWSCKLFSYIQVIFASAKSLITVSSAEQPLKISHNLQAVSKTMPCLLLPIWPRWCWNPGQRGSGQASLKRSHLLRGHRPLQHKSEMCRKPHKLGRMAGALQVWLCRIGSVALHREIRLLAEAGKAVWQACRLVERRQWWVSSSQGVASCGKSMKCRHIGRLELLLVICGKYALGRYAMKSEFLCR